MATERTDSAGAVAGLHRRSAAERIHETVRYLLRSWELYVFVLPAVIHVLLFRYLPIYGLRIAFTDGFSLRSGRSAPEWNEFAHFLRTPGPIKATERAQAGPRTASPESAQFSVGKNAQFSVAIDNGPLIASRGADARGFPAHAGMGLTLASSRSMRTRFSCPRRDRLRVSRSSAAAHSSM